MKVPRALRLSDLVQLDRAARSSTWASAVTSVREAVAELRDRTVAQAAWLERLGAASGAPAALRPLAMLQGVTLETLDGCVDRLGAAEAGGRRGPTLYATARDMQGCNSAHSAFEAMLVEALTPHRGALASHQAAVGRVLACRVGQSCLLRQVQRTAALGAEAYEGTGLPPGHDGAGPLVSVSRTAEELAQGMHAVLGGSAAEARTVCERTYGHAPEVHVDVQIHDAAGQGGEEDELRYVPSHLAHVANELIKNALESTLRVRSSRGPVRVEARVGPDGVEIDVVDEGAGMQEERLGQAFQFLGSSRGDASRVAGTDAERGGHVSGGRYHVQPPLSGLGVGLAISRALVGHFGGALALANVRDGRGCVATVRLPLRADAQAESWE